MYEDKHRPRIATVVAETEAREAREKAAEEKKELEGMRKFRDYRLGK